MIHTRTMIMEKTTSERCSEGKSSNSKTNLRTARALVLVQQSLWR